jgi:hypothetical protein
VKLIGERAHAAADETIDTPRGVPRSAAFLDGKAAFAFVPPRTPMGNPLYCNSLVTACCVLLACARALMPVWVRIWYFDNSDVALV